MSDILKRSIAPITSDAWSVLESQAKLTLKDTLSARKMVDFSGPHGWDYSGVAVGLVKVYPSEPIPGVKWGLREIQPLIEYRIPFKLNIWELDNISRGMKNPDLESLLSAAKKAALFEDTVVYQGFTDANVTGILKSSPHTPVQLPSKIDDLQGVVEDAVAALRASGIGGPYSLVLGFEPYKMLLKAHDCGYSLYQRIKELLGGHIVLSFAIDGGVLLSSRGGDFEMTVGQDLSIGYQSHCSENVELYFTESFTFQVLTPEAAIGLAVPKKK
ncbi:MAG: bacteriocin [Candidatus Auribacter fodinae]|jgi:uncharacterized linocin/CFP29 family protein|uniref:Bacteriocin n=1 Tax=Candidatus Auribacter fodinae TaxID=2093366 RepID=A0A3A4QU19_9BACT|nr:MAG: bacteriocin [Candidatus Auribacter fodinae]